jgi:hypothetical protein
VATSDPPAPDLAYWRPPQGGHWVLSTSFAPDEGGLDYWYWEPNGDPKPGEGIDNGTHYSFEELTNFTRTPDGRPNKDYPPQQVDTEGVPTLVQVWDTAPLIPSGSVGPSGGSGEPAGSIGPPQQGAWRVHTGTIRDAENRILTETRSQVSEYEALKADLIASGPEAWGSGTQSYEMYAAEDGMFLATADAIHLVGTYVAALNDAAQSYALADIESKPPAP